MKRYNIQILVETEESLTTVVRIVDSFLGDVKNVTDRNSLYKVIEPKSLSVTQLEMELSDE